MKIKAVQLDLARQKENLNFIYSFIDFIKCYGYNTLVLYLEGIVKTKSFTRIRGKDTYEPEEIRKIVDYAAKNGLDVIPVVSSLGHTEMFLEHPDHADMAELKGNTQGRWPEKKLEMSCPSNDQTYKFFERYFSEVSELFPGKYFHAGLDETWQIGMCGVCKKRFKDDKKGDFIYADHVQRIHAIVKKLGKTMMMWDDMFEIYPEAIHHIPTDIVLCSWYYDHVTDRPPGHFANRVRRDVFGEYDKLGFEYLFCPRELSALNVCGITRYAAKHKPLGGLMTTWEKSVEFYAETYPIIAMAGKLWSSPNTAFEQIVEECIRQTTGVNTIQALTAIKTWFFRKRTSYRLAANFTLGEVASLEEFQERTLETLLAILNGDHPGPNDVLEDISIAMREQLLNFRMRKAIYETIRAEIEGKKGDDFSLLQKEKENIRHSRLLQWNKFRQGFSNDPLKHSFDMADTNFSQLMEKIESADAYLFIRFFLPEVWASPWINLIVENNRGEKIPLVNQAILKPPIEELSFYEYVFPLKISGTPKALTIEIAGYGGQGISYAKLFDKNGVRYVPESIRETSGQIDHPAAILTDDLRRCYLGDQEVLRGFCSPGSAQAIHRLTFNFSAEKSF